MGKELLGIYVSGHPLDAHETITKKAHLSIAKVKTEPQPGISFSSCPMLVTEARAILTKKRREMAFIKIEDKTDSARGSCLPEALETT